MVWMRNNKGGYLYLSSTMVVGALNYARRILQNNDPQPESDQPANMQDWCVCGNCIIMPTPDENKCCKGKGMHHIL